MAMSHQQFVDAVYKLYLGSDTERHWSIGDMEKFVGEASRLGILLLADLGKYHREFIADHFSDCEKLYLHCRTKLSLHLWLPTKAFGQGCPPTQLKFPDHFHNDPYTLEQIHDTAWFVLHGTTSLSLTLDDTCTPALTMASVAKVEPTELSTLIDMMKQAIATLSTPSAPAPQVKPRPQHHMTTIVISVGVSIGKVAAKYSRSVSVTGSVYSTMMAISHCLVDISFLAPSPGKPLENILTNGTTRIWPPPLLLMHFCWMYHLTRQ